MEQAVGGRGKGVRVNSGCLGASSEEGRGKLRKVSGSCKRAMIRGYPNGATHHMLIGVWYQE